MMQIGENRQIIAENLAEYGCLEVGARIQAKLSDERKASSEGESYLSLIEPRTIRRIKHRLTAPPSEFEDHLQSKAAQAWQRTHGRAQYRLDARIQNGAISPADREGHEKKAVRTDSLIFNSQEIPIDPRFTHVALAGLEQVAQRGRVWGFFNQVKPSVAREMIATFQMQEAADSAEQTTPISVDTLKR